MNNKFLYITFCILLCSLFLFNSCQNKTKEDKPTVYVSIEPLRFFTEKIAGNQWNIVSMVPKGSSPETYDPTPAQLIQLAQSKGYLAVGHLGFELQWLDKLKENAPHVHFCETSKGLDYLEGHHYHEGEEHGDGVDPHVWTTPSNALILARNICSHFCKMDSKNAESYRQNYVALEKEIKQTDSIIKQIMSRPHAKAFGIYHPSLTYFAHDYGLEQLSIEVDGKEPSPTHLKQLINQCKEHGVKTIFIQKEFNTQNAEIIAKETHAKLVTINPLNYEWQKEIIQIAKSLQE